MASDGRGIYPGRVREGDTPSAQLGGMIRNGRALSSPIGGLERSPRHKRFFALKNPESYAKKAATKRPFKYISHIIVYTRTSYNIPDNHYEFDTLANDNY